MFLYVPAACNNTLVKSLNMIFFFIIIIYRQKRASDKNKHCLSKRYPGAYKVRGEMRNAICENAQYRPFQMSMFIAKTTTVYMRRKQYENKKCEKKKIYIYMLGIPTTAYPPNGKDYSENDILTGL